MSLKLMYITNKPEVAIIAEKYGVDRIWVDLEWRGKEERQKGLNTVKSNHVIEDVSNIKNSLKSSDLLVRVNSIYEESQREIDEVIRRGADIVMLPMFRTIDEVNRFVYLVNGRAKTMLLVETIEAKKNLKDIVRVPGVNEIHIGLNDLHLEYKKKFMFELLANGIIEEMCSTIKDAKIPYGFGGIARLNEGKLPAKYIISEHYRLGSECAILSRGFCDSSNMNLDQIEEVFRTGISEIHEYEKLIELSSKECYSSNQKLVKDLVNNILVEINERDRKINETRL